MGKLPPRLLAQARVIAKGNRIRDVQRLVTRYGGRLAKWIEKSSPPVEIGEDRFEYRKIRAEEETADTTMTVRLKKPSARHRDLSTRQPYMVIGIEADDYRILNDAGRPYRTSTHLVFLL